MLAPISAVPRRLDGRSVRKGVILPLAALFIVIVLASVALAVDLGYLCLARAQAQNTADATALAAAGHMLSDWRTQEHLLYQLEGEARGVAVEYAANNPICGSPPKLDRNDRNSLDGDLVFGRRKADGEMSIPRHRRDYNSVYVRIRRTNEVNGPISLFFASVLGTKSASVTAEAIATFNGKIGSFEPTPKTGNSRIMPFALNVDAWRDLMDGRTGSDNYAVDQDTNDVWIGTDGIPELVFYPEKLAAGNFGTVNIGNGNNSTSELIEQIVNGITPEDAAMHGGEIGTGIYSGDTGVSVAVKDGFAKILGQPRTVMLYRTVSGPGDNAEFEIVGFAGVRVMSYWDDGGIDSKGSPFRLVLQPAVVVDDSAVSGRGRVYSVYQPLALTK